MSFQKNTFNDFQLFENASEDRSLDITDVMLDRHLKIIDHNKTLPLNDIKKLKRKNLETIDCTEDKIIRIRRKKRAITSDDISRPEKNRFPLISPLLKYKKFKSRTVSIIEPLARLHPETLDIRNLQYIPREKHPDIYIHIPMHKNIMKLGKKHKKTLFRIGKRTAKIGIIFGIVTLSIAVFAVGLKNYIQYSTTEQYQRLFALKTLRDPVQIQEESEKIRSQFARLGIIFAPIDLAFNNSLYSNESVKLAHNVIYGGKEVAEMTSILATLVESGKEFATTSRPTIQSSDAGVFGKFASIKITDFLRDNEDYLYLFRDHLNKAIHYYGQIKNLGDPVLDAKFNQAFELLYKAQKYTNFTLENFDALLYALGDTKPVRYVILNQNRDEIRATGGFPGSVITLEFYKGAIQKYDKHDVYYYDWHLYPYKETPPEGLHKIAENFGLRDANYYPEFSKSLEKINFFYEKAGGGSIDVLVAINQGLVIDLLAKYGSVHLNEINSDVTAENFSTLMSVLVENKLNAKISPKDILFRFSEELEKLLIEKKDFV